MNDRRAKAMTAAYGKGRSLSDIKQPDPVVLSDLYDSEWSFKFERLMRNRLVMGALRYGKLNAPGKKQWDRIPDMIRRLKAYVESGNLEHLVDVPNLCLLEFEEGSHPLKHFASQDDSEHTEEKRKP